MTNQQLGVLLQNMHSQLSALVAEAEDALPDVAKVNVRALFKKYNSVEAPALYGIKNFLNDLDHQATLLIKSTNTGE